MASIEKKPRTAAPPVAQASVFKRMRGQKQLMLMSLPILAYVVLVFLLPIWGWTMAFQNYKPARRFLRAGMGRVQAVPISVQRRYVPARASQHDRHELHQHGARLCHGDRVRHPAERDQEQAL